MSRVTGPVLLLALLCPGAGAADLPPGAVARLGDPNFRAGSRIDHLALSPDGTQYATVRRGDRGNVLVAVCDAATGRVLRECAQNHELFGGLVWAPGGAHAAVIRGEAGQNDKLGKVFPGDFRIWNFADLKSDPPPALPVGGDYHSGPTLGATGPAQSPRYSDFRFGAAGTRVAARWKSADGRKHAIHVFELKPALTTAKLTQCGTIDLGAEGADQFLVSADCKTVLTFRKLQNTDPTDHADQYAVTAWNLSGKPSKPVQVRTYWDGRLMLTPDACGLVLYVPGGEEWGFDLFDLGTRTRRKLARWKYAVPVAESGVPDDRGGFAFSADGRVLAVAIDGKTLVLDVRAGRELGKLEGHADTPTAVAISADGATIATADAYGLVRLWNTRGLTPRVEAPGHRAPVRHAELSPDGKRLLTWAGDETVRLWDIATGKELRAFTGAPGLLDAERALRDQPTFTPDGTTILYGTKDRLVARDLLSGLEVPLPGDMRDLKPRFAAFAPDGKGVLTWAGAGEPVEAWGWPDGKKRFVIDTSHPGGAGFSPDSKTVYVGAQGWDAKTGEERPPPRPDGDELHQLRALRPNAPLILDNHDGRPPRVLQCGAGQLVPTPPLDNVRTGGHFWPGDGVAFAPNYRQFAGVFEFENGKAVVSETATGQERRSLGGHRGEVRVLGFTPDGTKLLTAGGDHTVLVWDMRLTAVPLPDALKQETNAAKLWDRLATGNAKDAYLAMARLSREPEAAVKMARLRLKPAPQGEPETDAGCVADARGVELLEALGTGGARALLKELAGGHPAAFRTQEAKRTLEPREKAGYNAKAK